MVPGIILCITGLAIFAYVHPIDFLEPGFVRDGVLIQDEYLSPNESFYTTMSIQELEEVVTLSIINPLNDVKLRTEIKDPYGITIHDDYETKITLNTQIRGNYDVTITNIGTEKTKITVIYGHELHETFYNQNDEVLKASWLVLLIIGSYLLVHTDYRIKTKILR